MANNTPTGDPIIEEVIEECLRLAIRASLHSWGLDNVKISTFWLGDETERDEVKALEPPFVLIKASPNTYDGYTSPIRRVMVEISVLTLQDADAFTGQYSKRNIYSAVRRVLDEATFALSEPIQPGYAWQITGSDSGMEENQAFERASITVQFDFAV